MGWAGSNILEPPVFLDRMAISEILIKIEDFYLQNFRNFIYENRIFQITQNGFLYPPPKKKIKASFKSAKLSSTLNNDKTFKNKEELKNIFQSCLENISEKNIIFSCGSGVTACVLALAYSLINDKYHPCIYDGSWAEYGII